MKKIILTVALLTGLIGFAQKGEHRGERKGQMQDMTPEQVATLQTKKLTLALDLTETQQQEIQKLNVDNAVLRKEKMEARKASREDGEHKKPTSDERFNMQKEHLDRAIAQKEKMKEILSEEQFEKWEKIQMKRGHRKGHKGKHGRGHSKPRK